jgi:hypothetical protein
MNRSLVPTYKRFYAKSQWIENLILRGRTLDVLSQRLVGELAILYLAISIEQAMEEICLKICCGATYLDGSIPQLNTRCKSNDHAAQQLKSFGRTRRTRIQYMKWLNTRDITQNIQHVVTASDPLFNILAMHANTLELIRVVRNHVAHRSKSTLMQYRLVVQQLYGPISKAVEPGTFLMSERRSSPSQINIAIIGARVLVKDIVRE